MRGCDPDASSSVIMDDDARTDNNNLLASNIQVYRYVLLTYDIYINTTIYWYPDGWENHEKTNRYYQNHLTKFKSAL